jgi:hypothetical protein
VTASTVTASTVTASTVTAPPRIGVLGAARIAEEGIIDPAKALGHEVVAAARPYLMPRAPLLS